MTKYLKYLPYVLALVLFLAGRWTAPQPDKELRKKFEAERESILEVIGQKDAQIVRLNEASHAIEKERVQDSLRFAGALESNKRAYSALKRKYNEINLNRANAHTLDSLVSVLFPD